MSIVKYGSSISVAPGSKEILVPDANGYYDMTIGALNSYNSQGHYYTANECLHLFDTSSSLKRRIGKRALCAELGHPKKLPGMSMDDFYNRIITIEETNICAHIAEITLDLSFGKNNPDITNRECIAIIGKVAPSGIKAEAFERAIKNKLQNAAFSIRALSDNFRADGKYIRKLLEVITFDFVNEPGISIADKFTAPSLESYAGEDELVDVERFKIILSEHLSNPRMALESTEVEFREDLLRAISQTKEVTKKNRSILTW